MERAVQVAQKTPPHLRQWWRRSNNVKRARQANASQRAACRSGFHSSRGRRTARCSSGRMTGLPSEETLDEDEPSESEGTDELRVRSTRHVRHGTTYRVQKQTYPTKTRRTGRRQRMNRGWTCSRCARGAASSGPRNLLARDTYNYARAAPVVGQAPPDPISQLRSPRALASPDQPHLVSHTQAIPYPRIPQTKRLHASTLAPYPVCPTSVYTQSPLQYEYPELSRRQNFRSCCAPTRTIVS